MHKEFDQICLLFKTNIYYYCGDIIELLNGLRSHLEVSIDNSDK